MEAPSQMFEFRCYEKEPLKLLSENFPLEFVDKIKKMKNSFSAYKNKRQLHFGIFDLKVHSLKFNDLHDKFDVKQIWNDTLMQVRNIDNNCYTFCAFTHLLSGYEAGYYGYLRAESYASNMFYVKFKDGHILDHNVGKEYRTLVLEKGSIYDSLDDKYFLMAKGLK